MKNVQVFADFLVIKQQLLSYENENRYKLPCWMPVLYNNFKGKRMTL